MGLIRKARRLFDIVGQRNAASWTTMVAGYANNGDRERANGLYERMVEKNSVAWVAMIAGYGKLGNVVEAEMVFDKIQMPDVSCWSATVACYAQNGHAEEAIGFNEVAMVGAISACTQLGGVEIAATLAKHVEERVLQNSEVFIQRTLNLVSYPIQPIHRTRHGTANDVVDLFSEMQRDRVRPNQVTFVSLLNACSHAGLVEEGCRYFELMTQVFGIEPLKEHYACMVDLLGRAGLLEKASNLVIDYVGVADAKIWGPLLGACKVHGNAELSEIAARHLFEIEPRDTENYELLANTYAEANKWDDADRMKKMMTQRGMGEAPGCSWRGSTV
ncbi:pentatricopeptide repeat-containing protein [Pyrus ussuriensis x Pyrus communis]|uniref:Pentatricopeptide repeat-containing protein n=1 Tax=Pyrus ussuriensis x Pyrus communis TaxID=2448454 RepID=A0A5N5GBN9_9ROSA|nr:pentatricopeptide repeat-containing protein [Pyrus ussuriensis x Pyrus communis]